MDSVRIKEESDDTTPIKDESVDPCPLEWIVKFESDLTWTPPEIDPRGVEVHPRGVELHRQGVEVHPRGVEGFPRVTHPSSGSSPLHSQYGVYNPVHDDHSRSAAPCDGRPAKIIVIAPTGAGHWGGPLPVPSNPHPAGDKDVALPAASQPVSAETYTPTPTQESMEAGGSSPGGKGSMVVGGSSPEEEDEHDLLVLFTERARQPAWQIPRFTTPDAPVAVKSEPSGADPHTPCWQIPRFGVGDSEPRCTPGEREAGGNAPVEGAARRHPTTSRMTDIEGTTPNTVTDTGAITGKHSSLPGAATRRYVGAAGRRHGKNIAGENSLKDPKAVDGERALPSGLPDYERNKENRSSPANIASDVTSDRRTQTVVMTDDKRGRGHKRSCVTAGQEYGKRSKMTPTPLSSHYQSNNVSLATPPTVIGEAREHVPAAIHCPVGKCDEDPHCPVVKCDEDPHCPVCTKGLYIPADCPEPGRLRKHVSSAHFPWYVSMDGRRAGDTPLAAALHPLLAPALQKRSLVSEPLYRAWGRLLEGLLQHLAGLVGLVGTRELYEHFLEQKQYPGGALLKPAGGKLPRELLPAVKAHLSHLGQSTRALSFSPPSCTSGMLHWVSLTNLMCSLTEEEQAGVRRYEAYGLSEFLAFPGVPQVAIPDTISEQSAHAHNVHDTHAHNVQDQHAHNVQDTHVHNVQYPHAHNVQDPHAASTAGGVAPCTATRGHVHGLRDEEDRGHPVGAEHTAPASHTTAVPMDIDNEEDVTRVTDTGGPGEAGGGEHGDRGHPVCPSMPTYPGSKLKSQTTPPVTLKTVIPNTEVLDSQIRSVMSSEPELPSMTTLPARCVSRDLPGTKVTAVVATQVPDPPGGPPRVPPLMSLKLPFTAEHRMTSSQHTVSPFMSRQTFLPVPPHPPLPPLSPVSPPTSPPPPAASSPSRTDSSQPPLPPLSPVSPPAPLPPLTPVRPPLPGSATRGRAKLPQSPDYRFFSKFVKPIVGRQDASWKSLDGQSLVGAVPSDSATWYQYYKQSYDQSFNNAVTIGNQYDVTQHMYQTQYPYYYQQGYYFPQQQYAASQQLYPTFYNGQFMPVNAFSRPYGTVTSHPQQYHTYYPQQYTSALASSTHHRPSSIHAKINTTHTQARKEHAVGCGGRYDHQTPDCGNSLMDDLCPGMKVTGETASLVNDVMQETSKSNTPSTTKYSDVNTPTKDENTNDSDMNTPTRDERWNDSDRTAQESSNTDIVSGSAVSNHSSPKKYDCEKHPGIMEHNQINARCDVTPVSDSDVTPGNDGSKTEPNRDNEAITKSGNDSDVIANYEEGVYIVLSEYSEDTDEDTDTKHGGPPTAASSSEEEHVRKIKTEKEVSRSDGGTDERVDASPGHGPSLAACPVCASRLPDARLADHVLRDHLPWYMSVGRKGEVRSTRLSRQLMPVYRGQYERRGEGVPHKSFTWAHGRLLNGLLKRLAEGLGLPGVSALVRYCNEEGLTPDGVTYEGLDRADSRAMRSHRHYSGNAGGGEQGALCVHPASCPSALLHWHTLAGLVTRLPRDQHEGVATFERYTGRTLINPGRHRTPDATRGRYVTRLGCGIRAGDQAGVWHALSAFPELVRREDAAGRPPLEVALRHGRYTIATMLALCGADVDQPDSAGRGSLAEAVTRGSLTAVTFLLRWGVSPREVSRQHALAARDEGKARLVRAMEAAVPALTGPHGWP